MLTGLCSGWMQRSFDFSCDQMNRFGPESEQKEGSRQFPCVNPLGVKVRSRTDRLPALASRPLPAGPSASQARSASPTRGRCVTRQWRSRPPSRLSTEAREMYQPRREWLSAGTARQRDLMDARSPFLARSSAPFQTSYVADFVGVSSTLV